MAHLKQKAKECGVTLSKYWEKKMCDGVLVMPRICVIFDYSIMDPSGYKPFSGFGEFPVCKELK